MVTRPEHTHVVTPTEVLSREGDAKPECTLSAKRSERRAKSIMNNAGWPQMPQKGPERAGKPNSVRQPGSRGTLRSPEPPAGAAIIPLGPKSPSGSSSRPGDVPPEAGRDGRPASPYLALLRMGFTV